MWDDLARNNLAREFMIHIIEWLFMFEADI